MIRPAAGVGDAALRGRASFCRHGERRTETAGRTEKGAKVHDEAEISSSTFLRALCSSG